MNANSRHRRITVNPAHEKSSDVLTAAAPTD
jgi:hypothetical protein